MNSQLDDTDLKILDILQRDCSQSNAQIAAAVNTSMSPCWRRISRLESEGFIVARRAVLDPAKIGLAFQVFVMIKLTFQGRIDIDHFKEAVRSIPEILECYPVMGSSDFLLKIMTRDIEAYERLFHKRMVKLPGVCDISSMVAFSNVKNETGLPLRLGV